MADFTLADGTPIVWAHGADWGAGAHGFGEENYELDLTALANGKARQGVKGDLGATRKPTFAVKVGIEFGGTAPASTGVTVQVYWSSSISGTAGTGNDGGASGADAAYKDSEETEWLRQLTYVGALTATADGAGTVQIGTINEAFQPPMRYGMPVVLNTSGVALDADATNMFVALVPTSPASS